jgi:hypothetical protein
MEGASFAEIMEIIRFKILIKIFNFNVGTFEVNDGKI